MKSIDIRNISRRVFVLLLVVGTVSCKEKRPERVFHEEIQKSPLGICMFFLQDSSTEKNPSLMEKIENTIQVFRDVFKYEGYREAELMFFELNVADIDVEKHLSNLGVSKRELPAFALYIEGRPVSKKGQYAVLHGFVSHDQIHAFIKKYLGTEIEEARKEYKKQKEYKERRRYRRYYYPYYHGYPYYWHRPYYGGIGFGFGFGHHSGYGRYRRHHW